MLEEKINKNIPLEENNLQLDSAKISETSENNVELQTNETLSNENLIDKLSTDNNLSNSNDDIQTNCLALTVRKDYNLVIVKNIFTATGRLSWKVILATLLLNLLNLIF